MSPDELTVAVQELVDERDLPLVASIHVAGEPVVAIAHGSADRRHGAPNTVETRFALASGTKAFTALAVMSLVSDGVLALDERVRPLLRDDLPMIDDRVTIEHLLGHTSGIGDYLDEELLESSNDYVMPLPVHVFDRVDAYLPILDGRPQVSPPGERFTYNNGGYVVLAVLIERASGRRYADVVHERVIEPAGLGATGFVRSDELPPEAAIGYLELTGLRSNVLHMPVVGVGDGGIYSTVADLDRLWRAFYAGVIVPSDLVALMVAPRPTGDEFRYGLGGFWLAASGPAAIMEGGDAGVSLRSIHDPTTHTTATAVSNTSDGAWPVARLFVDIFAG